MKVSLDFNNDKDADLVMTFRGIGVKMKRNIYLFPNTPVDLDAFLAMVDKYNDAMIAAADGSRTAIAQRNKLRAEATRMATYLGHYVESVAQDLETIYAAGLKPANRYRLLPKPLPKTGFNKIVRGPNSGTALAYITPISRSNGKVSYYEMRYAPKIGEMPGDFTVIPTHVARFPITIKDLTPGTIYIFQVRAANKIGFNDWSDPIGFMAT